MELKTILRKCPLIIFTLLISLFVGAFIGTGKVMTTSASLTDELVPSASVTVAANTVSSLPDGGSSASSSPSSAASNATQQTPSGNEPAAKMGQLPNAFSQKKSLGAVNQDYFSDALFVGDSLTEGLKEYGHLDSASYFYRVGLSIYQIFESPKKDAQSGLTFEEMLKKREYGKIYFLLGINEIGTGTDDYFVRHYSSALQKVRALQPNAIIYIQSILPVTAEKSSGGVFSNKRIHERNLKLKQLADGEHIFFLNVSSAYADKDGCLPKQYSGDGVHIKAKYYPIWTNYLMTHAALCQ
jgi:lysophospholipase L1-like esterase